MTGEETRMDVAVLGRIASFKFTCVMIAAERLDLYEHLREKTTPEKLAAELGYLEQPLARLFFALEACGIIYRDTDGWQLTHHGFRIIESPNRIREQIRGYDETMQAWQHLDEAVRADGNLLTPFHNQGGQSIWLSRAQDEARLRDFQEVMLLNVPAALDLLVAADADGQHPSFLPFTGTVADVGGGTGQLLMRLLDVYPQLEGILIEFPEVIQLAVREAIPDRLAERINLQPANVLDEDFRWDSDVSLLVNVLHDWNDERALAILKKCALASPRVLLIERFVRPGHENEVAMLDMQMMAVHGGRQRSIEEYSKMATEAGLKLTRERSGLGPSTGRSLLELSRC